MRKGKRIVMVATSAFGLGIDKPDIRYIVHYQAPASLERYVQEAGRAGRDGQIARCILLFDESDLAIQEHLLALSRLSPALLGRFGRALAAWAGEERDANIEELALSAGISQRAASSLVTALVEAGICERVDDGRVRAARRRSTRWSSASRACAAASRSCGARTRAACAPSPSTPTRPAAAAPRCAATSATTIRARAGAAISAGRRAWRSPARAGAAPARVASAGRDGVAPASGGRRSGRRRRASRRAPATAAAERAPAPAPARAARAVAPRRCGSGRAGGCAATEPFVLAAARPGRRRPRRRARRARAAADAADGAAAAPRRRHPCRAGTGGAAPPPARSRRRGPRAASTAATPAQA